MRIETHVYQTPFVRYRSDVLDALVRMYAEQNLTEELLDDCYDLIHPFARFKFYINYLYLKIPRNRG